MREEEKPELGKAIIAVGLMYEKEMTKMVIDLYWLALNDLELKAVERALQIHMRDTDRGRFMPKPADLRELICGPPKSAVIAWRQVERAALRHGYTATVQFTDGTINAVLRDLGGWQWLCSQNLDEPWTQKEFERRYEAYRAQHIELHEPLPGFHELGNRNNGYLDNIPDTILIGDRGDVVRLPPRIEKPALAGDNPLVKLLAGKMDMSGKEE